MRPINKIAKYYIGHHRLPAGAVPLASENMAAIVCLTPPGRWIRWWPADGLSQPLPATAQREVLETVIAQLGGTAASAADRLGVSPRTVEAWRCGKAALPIRAAYEIAEKLMQA